MKTRSILTAIAAFTLVFATLGSGDGIAQTGSMDQSAAPGTPPASTTPTPPSPAAENPTDTGTAASDMSGNVVTGQGTTDTIGEGDVPAGADVLVEIDDPANVEQRSGPEQRPTALMQTTLLNRFSQLGFSEVRDFRREGESYIAEALSKDGDWVTVVMDPMSGTIVARR